MKKRLPLLLTGILVALRCFPQRLQELLPASLARPSSQHLIKKNMHGLIVCNTIYLWSCAMSAYLLCHDSFFLPTKTILFQPRNALNEALVVPLLVI
jgi:hypothetical protein